MYSIINVIYGIPLGKSQGINERWMSNFRAKEDELLIEELLESSVDETIGWHLPYHGACSGANDRPVGFGIHLGEFDDARSSIDLEQIPKEVTQEHIQQFNELFAALPESHQTILKKYGSARVFFLFSTS